MDADGPTSQSKIAAGRRHARARMFLVVMAFVAGATGFVSAARTSAVEAPEQVGAALDILVFIRTEGFAHSSISDGVLMIESIAQDLQSTVTVTDQTTLFSPAGLAPLDVVIWLSTTGDVLDDPEQSAFEGYMQAGGGYIGIHAAADCEYGWPWYGELLGNGAWFSDHPSIQTATLERTGVPAGFPDPGFPDQETSFADEWYNFQANPRPQVTVLMTVDESSYDPGSGAMGADHPIVWAHEFQGGRAYYTGLGHRSQTFQDIRFRGQIQNAILWAGGADGLLFSDGFESGTTNAWQVGP